MNDTPPPTICLDQFLKANALAETGGHAKMLIQHGEVIVNGEIETRRRRKLVQADQVEVHGQTFVVERDESQLFFAREA